MRNLPKTRFAYVLFVLLATISTATADESGKYSDRWFYASFGLRSDAETAELIQLIQTAGAHDLNGMLWACGAETCGHWSPAARERALKIKAAAEEAGVEIIPILWSVGYGTMLYRDRNLVEGKEIRDLPFMEKDGKLVFVPETDFDAIENPGFEEFDGNRVKNADFHDQPGTVSFIDTEIKRSGAASLRLENFTSNPHGHGRLALSFPVVPHRQYCLHGWYNAENLDTDGKFRVQLYALNPKLDAAFASVTPHLPESGTTDGWQEFQLNFNSGDYTEVRMYAGLWGGTKGTLRLDDLRLESLGMVNPLQRPGTPITVRNAKTGEIYTSGQDYTLPEFRLRFGNFASGESLAFDLPEGSKIGKGTRVTVDFYVPIATLNGQLSVCMSEPELYEFFEDSAQQVMELFAPKKWFLSMDEIRAGGSCKACKDSGLTLGQTLGKCITQQFEIIRQVQPDAEVYIWSDMLDPLHNCHADYYACEGDFAGVCDYIPKEIIVSCWHFRIREESMKYFSDRGFRTQAAAYYDKDEQLNFDGWLDTCSHTPGCTGIMYTTWQHKYENLIPFSDTLKRRALDRK